MDLWPCSGVQSLWLGAEDKGQGGTKALHQARAALVHIAVLLQLLLLGVLCSCSSVPVRGTWCESMARCVRVVFGSVMLVLLFYYS